MSNPMAEQSVEKLWAMHGQIEAAKHDLHYAERRFLEASGWKATSTTPGCYWLWEKTLPDGRTVLVQQDLAISMQCRLMPAPDGAYED